MHIHPEYDRNEPYPALSNCSGNEPIHEPYPVLSNCSGKEPIHEPYPVLNDLSGNELNPEGLSMI